jgi:AcrR family transcriptional regulator
MTSGDTKERLLDAAEAIFAERGFTAASLRAITRRADANLAAVHYHFGSKGALFGAVFDRRIAPINRERLARLDTLEQAAGDRPVPMEELLRAFVEPACSVAGCADQGARFLRLSGRMFSEPGTHWEPVRLLMEPLKRRFVEAFSRSLPGIEASAVFWRLHFVIGALSHALASGQMLTFFSEGVCDGEDLDGMLAQLVPFLTAGMRAPAAEPAQGVSR